MPDNYSGADSEILQNIIAALRPLAPDDRRRILLAVATFYEVDIRGSIRTARGEPTEARSPMDYLQEESMSVKEFMLEKQPKTDVERVACLAFYLTHYKSQPRFKTLDISKLNTEAAQPKFANTAYTMKNAVRLGYLAPATQGMRQLSAVGEQFVRALPDRAAAKAVMSAMRPRRSRRKKSIPTEVTEET